MPRTRNITREQWKVAGADPSASAIRPQDIASTQQHQRQTNHSSFVYTDASADSSLKENRGYDDDDDDENAENENIPPSVVVDSKGNTKAKEELHKGKKRKQRPLQDITDLVVSHGNRPSDLEDTPRGGRRVKRRRHERPPLAPIRPPLTIKHTPGIRKLFPSSLPPSSPPPPASFELPTSSAHQRNEVWEDLMPEEQEDLPLASDDSEPARNSDPFGFFAVEKELKAQRYRDNRPIGELREAGGLILVPASSPPPLHLDITAVLDDEGVEEANMSPCATPTTPHKKKRARRLSILGKGKEREELLFSPHTDSLPSSPSPIKARTPRVKEGVLRDRSDFVRSRKGRSDSVDEKDSRSRNEGDGKETVKNTPPRRVLRSGAKGKQPDQPKSLPAKTTRAKRQRENKSKTPSDPVECAQRLIDRLPKRRRKKTKDEEDSEEVKPSRAKRQRKPQISKKTTKVEKLPKAKSEVDPKREAIRDYFKSLEAYSLQEEKVYVI